jgi:hypothetical protein
MKWTERPWSIRVVARVGVDGAFSNLVLVVFDVLGAPVIQEVFSRLFLFLFSFFVLSRIQIRTFNIKDHPT